MPVIAPESSGKMRPPRLIHISGFLNGRMLQCGVFTFLFLTVFAFCSAPVLGATTLSLEEAERMAVEESLEVRLAGADVKIRESFKKETSSAYYPQVYSRIVAPFIGRESGFFADQVIWDFGRTRNRVKSSESLVAMAGFSKKRAAGEAVRKVRTAFYKVLLEQARLVYSEKSHQLALMKLERSRILEKNGRISALELAERESEENSVLFELRGARNRIEVARFTLFQLIGVEDADGITLEAPVDPEDVAVTPSEVLPRVFANNSHLRALAEQLKSDEAGMASARAEFFPVLYGRVAYRFKGEGAETPGFIAGAGASVPIFKGFSRFAGLDRARAAREKTEIEIALEKRRLESKVRRLILDIVHADKDIKLSRQILGNAEKKLILAREKSELGAASKVDLVFSEKEYAKFYLNYEESMYNRRVLLAELSFLADGVPLRERRGEVE